MTKVSIKFRICLFIAGALIVLAIIFLKSASAYKLNPVYSLYSLFVILFVGSRIIAAFFYKSFKVKESGYWPSVSIIIPVFNEEVAISATIQHCFSLDYPKDKLEVVAINDGSTDNSYQELYALKQIYPALQLINFKKNKGKRQAMTAGIRKAQGEVIVQLDSDSYLSKTSLKSLVSVFEDKQLGGVSAHTEPVNKDANILTKMQAAYYFVSFRILKAAESSLGIVFCCSGCCSAYRREYLLPILDEWINEKHLGVRTVYGDDRSLTNLLIREGYSTAYSDTAQAFTIVPETLPQLLKQQRRWKKSWIINTARSARFILKRDPFIAFVYLFPQMLVTYSAPVLIVYSLIYVPLTYGSLPVIYLTGLLALYTIFLIVYSTFRVAENQNRSYIILWGGLSIFLISIIFPLALLTLRDGSWGTR